MPIVTLNVSQQVAPLPNTLQRMGALVSHGGTILSPGTLSYLTQLSDLTPLLRAAENVTSLTWNTSVVTATTTVPHGLPIGKNLVLYISGAVPSGYNGVFYTTITGTSTFTYPLAINPGTETTPGFWNVNDVIEITQMATTWFAQGVSIGAFVLELGPLNDVDAIAALSTYLTNNPNTAYTAGSQGFNYAYLIPRSWDNPVFAPSAKQALLNLVTQYEAPTAKTYFFITTTLATYQAYTAQMKSVYAEIESPQMAAYPQNPMITLAQSGGTVTGSTSVNHGVSPGDWFQLQGNTPSGYNGWWQAQQGTAGSVLTWNMPLLSPGAISIPGFLEANQSVNSGVASNEFSTAASMYDVISNNPSSSNKVPPLSYTFQFGVTPWPTQGMSSLFTTLELNSINYIKTGAEGGISTASIFLGHTKDGNGFLYWYSVDSVQLYSDENLANTVINGSNNRVNPLYYSQDGINRLQDSEYATIESLASWGLANGTQIVRTSFPASSAPGSNQMSLTDALDSGNYDGQIVVNAEPYLPYLTENPGDYRIGKYGGLSVQFIPSQGFESVVLNLVVTQLITSG